MSGAVLNTLPCPMGGSHEPFAEPPYIVGASYMILQRTGDPSIRDTLRTSETLQICTKCHSLLFVPVLEPMQEVVKRLPHIYTNVTEAGPELLDLTERADARALKALQASLAQHLAKNIMKETRQANSYFFNLA